MNPELGTRLASDISLYVIDNSLIGNKHKLLISGKKGEFIAAKIFKINVIHKIDYCYIAMKIRLSFTIMYNRTHKSDKTGEEYTVASYRAAGFVDSDVRIIAIIDVCLCT